MKDRLCLEHGFSIVEDPKPSRGHYGEWLGEHRQSFCQERLRRVIDMALEQKPSDYEDFIKLLVSSSVEVNRERKNLRLPGQKRFTRYNTLKGDYTEQAIKERIAGVRTVWPRAYPPQKVGLPIDIEAAVRAGKGPCYERRAKVFNLKTVAYFKEHGDMDYAGFLEKSGSATTNFNELFTRIKEL